MELPRFTCEGVARSSRGAGGRSRTRARDDLWTAVSILFLLRTLSTIVGVRDARPAADDASALVGAVVALVADAYERAGPHVGVADDAFAVALLAEAPDGDAGLFPAHDQIGVMLCHGGVLRL